MYRYTAYWQLARWAWGYLGEKIRVVLPSYDVTRIRKTFPNESGYYIGFKPSHHNYVKYYLFCYLCIVSLSITISAQNFNNLLYKDDTNLNTNLICLKMEPLLVNSNVQRSVFVCLNNTQKSHHLQN